MKFTQVTLVVLASIVMFSCKNMRKENRNDESLSKDTISSFQASSEEISTDEISDTTALIKFDGLSVTINRLIVFDYDKESIQKDTANLSIELGESIEGQKISISSNILNDIKIEQRYETSVTIQNEGPHCDLTDWMHYYSDWKPLKQDNNGQFICETYNDNDRERFPKININDLKRAVKEQCGDDWFSLVKNIKSPTEYPSGVGISHYYLKITGKHKTTRETITKYIILESPMGC